MEIREKVKQNYGSIAAGVGKQQSSSCCSGGSCCDSRITDTTINYEGMELTKLPQEAVELSLGCANPVVFANLQEGETVLDLGSGGGIDVLLGSTYVGDGGKIYGLDMTDEMLELANANKQRMGVSNVEFIKGYIEDIPLSDESVDVVLSNCVINLSEDKKKALSEAYRVLRVGGRLRIADVIAQRAVDSSLKKNVELWCGCLAGTITMDEYRRLLEDCGFGDVKIEIAHTYTKDVIRSEFLQHLEDGISEDLLESLDGAFAGALISADK